MRRRKIAREMSTDFVSACQVGRNYAYNCYGRSEITIQDHGFDDLTPTKPAQRRLSDLEDDLPEMTAWASPDNCLGRLSEEDHQNPIQGDFQKAIVPGSPSQGTDPEFRVQVSKPRSCTRRDRRASLPAYYELPNQNPYIDTRDECFVNRGTNGGRSNVIINVDLVVSSSQNIEYADTGRFLATCGHLATGGE